MDGQRDDIRQVPDPNSINKQQIPHGQEVPSPQQIPGREIFLERPDVPTQEHMPTTQSHSTEWIHTRQGFIRPRKNPFQHFIDRFFHTP
ncbi:MAG TPA: hypothetical protein VFB12_19545 [Ktedonobacteraceae bacterium]|nr:hypothetical protein [Ktedonobacteraceae bacterium]